MKRMEPISKKTRQPHFETSSCQVIPMKNPGVNPGKSGIMMAAAGRPGVIIDTLHRLWRCK